MGWIHATTTMKEVFTGDLSVKWQYTVRVDGSLQMKVAPAQDLQWVESHAPFPVYVMYKESVSDKNYLQETRLHAIGYQISDLNSQQRWSILKFVAIPMLGASEVVRTIMAVISSRIIRPANAGKFRHAIREWNRDLNAIAVYCKGGEDAAALCSSISYIQRKLLDVKMIEEKDVLTAERKQP
jgi:hypothetical protein